MTTPSQSASNKILNVNSLIKWVDGDGKVRYERLLIIDAASNICFTIRTDTPSDLPTKKDFEQFQCAIENGKAERVPPELDPYGFIQGLKDEDLPPLQKEIRDKAWNAILQLVQDPKREIFDPRLRGKLIQKAATESKLPVSKIYRSLERFWQRGQVPNALLPDYKNCGIWTPERKTVNKRGRPRKTDEPGQPRNGINIGEREEKQIIRGLKTFYLVQSEKPITLERAYELTMLEYFVPTPKVSEKLNIKAILANPAINKFLPSEAQFRYVLTKNFSPSER